MPQNEFNLRPISLAADVGVVPRDPVPPRRGTGCLFRHAIGLAPQTCSCSAASATPATIPAAVMGGATLPPIQAAEVGVELARPPAALTWKHLHLSNLLSIMLTYGFHTLLIVGNAQCQMANDGGLLGIHGQAICTLAIVHVALISGFIGPAHRTGVTLFGVRIGWWSPKQKSKFELAVQALFVCLTFFGSGMFLFYNKHNVRVECPSTEIGQCTDQVCPLVIVETIIGFENGSGDSAGAGADFVTSVLNPGVGNTKRIRVQQLVGPSEWYTCRFEGDGTWTRTYSFVDALYFVTVLTSSVGYGHELFPTHPWWRVSTGFFATTGVLMWGVLIFLLSRPVHSLVDSVSGFFSRLAPSDYGATTSSHTDQAFTPAPWFKLFRHLVRLLIAFVVWVTVTAYIFMVLEGWSFQDAIYHCMMTATTVGLGDIAPITPSGRTFAIVHMLGSFMLFAGLLETVGSVPSVREEMASLAEMQSNSVDPEFFARLDTNTERDGVDRYEFVVGLLVQFGKVDAEFVEMLNSQFDEVDVDHSGHLDATDLRLIAEKAAERAKLPDTRQSRLRERAESMAHSMAFCTGLSCINVLWWCTFGWCALASGVSSAFALVCILGSAPSHAVYVHATVAAGFSTLAALAAGVAFWMAGFAQEQYFGSGIDDMLMYNFYGQLNGVEVELPAELAPGVPLSYAAMNVVAEMYFKSKPWGRIIHIIFPFYFIVAAGLSLTLSVTCAQLAAITKKPTAAAWA